MKECYSIHPSYRWTSRYIWAALRTPSCVWGQDCTCHVEPRPQPPGFRTCTQTYTHKCETLPFVARSRDCLGMFMWYLWDVHPSYCCLELQRWVFTTSSRWTSSYEPMRGIGHTIVWLTLIIAVWGRDWISYTNTRPTLNLSNLRTWRGWYGICGFSTRSTLQHNTKS